MEGPCHPLALGCHHSHVLGEQLHTQTGRMDGRPSQETGSSHRAGSPVGFVLRVQGAKDRTNQSTQSREQRELRPLLPAPEAIGLRFLGPRCRGITGRVAPVWAQPTSDSQFGANFVVTTPNLSRATFCSIWRGSFHQVSDILLKAVSRERVKRGEGIPGG